LDVNREVTHFDIGLRRIAAFREGGFQELASDLIRMKNKELGDLIEENSNLSALKRKNE
jgi:hypothetical protein